MTTAIRYANGTFCWTELHASDPDASRAFYKALFDWTTVETPNPHGGAYSSASRDGKLVAGIQSMDPESRAKGMPSHWLSYMAADDVDAFTRKAEGLGAQALYGPFDVADLGRAVVLKDPAGAFLALWQAGKHAGSELTDDEAGTFCWFDHYTTDLDQSKAFYGGMFGYAMESMDMGGMELVFCSPETPGAEKEFVMMNAMDGRPSAWQPFFSVKDADATLAKAVALGATVVCPVMDAGGGRFAHFQDPQGAWFGIMEWAN